MTRAFWASWIVLLLLAGCAKSPGFWSEQLNADGNPRYYYRITESKADPIGWVAEFRPRTSAWAGIPREAFFTTKEACEKARHTRRYKINLWSSKTEVPPSAPCHPVHYRSESQK